MNWIYDIETYPNIFTFCAVYGNGKGLRVYEVSSRKNETKELLEFLRNVLINKHSLVGFNNVGFDWQVMQHILMLASEAKSKGEEFTICYKEIYRFANELIKSGWEERFNLPFREKDFMIRQLDLMKIHHFDNVARATSLKMIEFNMRSESIEDLPFPPNTRLTDSQMTVLVEYNKHDVMKTYEFYLETLEAIEFREKLTKLYGFDCTNYNDTKIGKEYFINRLEKDIPNSCYKKQGRRKVVNQTKREKIHIGEILFPYLKYDSPEFIAIHEWFKSQVIRETKGVFSDFEEHEIGDVAKYASMKTKRIKIVNPKDKSDKFYEPTEKERSELLKLHPCGWFEKKELKSPKGAFSWYFNYNVVESMNVVRNGLQYVFGTGGIHASIESASVHSDDDYIIIDADVASMYPNIAISNRVYPLHLTERFCDIYQDVYTARKGFPKGSAENAVLKLALNGVYGDSNNQYSPFYDPQYTMTITINGQLSLLMLAERLSEIDECQIIQCNTDGVTVRIPRESREQYDEICSKWCEDVKLELEYAEYSDMFIRDVNNYIAVYTDGKIKRKGAYEYEGLGWHQNHSALVVPRAAEHELLGKGTVEEYVKAHTDKFDFMLRTKVPRDSRLVLDMGDGYEVEQQGTCRYYASVRGGSLVKVMPPLPNKPEAGERRIGIDVGWKVRTCNNINEFEWDINYDYYIEMARKLVDPLL